MRNCAPFRAIAHGVARVAARRLVPRACAACPALGVLPFRARAHYRRRFARVWRRRPLPTRFPPLPFPIPRPSPTLPLLFPLPLPLLPRTSTSPVPPHPRPALFFCVVLVHPRRIRTPEPPKHAAAPSAPHGGERTAARAIAAAPAAPRAKAQPASRSSGGTVPLPTFQRSCDRTRAKPPRDRPCANALWRSVDPPRIRLSPSRDQLAPAHVTVSRERPCANGTVAFGCAASHLFVAVT